MLFNRPMSTLSGIDRDQGTVIMRLASTQGRKFRRTLVGAVDCAVLIAGLFRQQGTMTLSAKLRLGMILVLWAPFAAAQSNLGELLDAGAKKLSVEEFKEELVQRVIVGLAPSGSGNLELMYANNGEIQGTGAYPPTFVSPQPIRGAWTTDDNGRVCTSMQIGNAAPQLVLPPRCQFWFKNAGQYFYSDSDSDRHARVFRRTLK
jgi:hypothetical protein